MNNKNNYEKNKNYIKKVYSADEIKEKLENYIRVDDLADVSLNTHMRYFTVKTDDKGGSVTEFHPGGFLKNKNNFKKYIYLTNGKVDWPVQTDSAVFYRKKSYEELKEMYEKQLQENNNKIKKLKEKIKEKDDKIRKLKEYINNKLH